MFRATHLTAALAGVIFATLIHYAEVSEAANSLAGPESKTWADYALVLLFFPIHLIMVFGVQQLYEQLKRDYGIDSWEALRLNWKLLLLYHPPFRPALTYYVPVWLRCLTWFVSCVATSVLTRYYFSG